MIFLKNKLLILTLGIFVFGTNAVAQDSEAVETFNAGLEQAKQKDYDAAIVSFKKAAELSAALGAGGATTKELAERQIPKMYYSKALTVFNGFRASKQLSELNQSIDLFNETLEIATQYKDGDVHARTKQVIPQLYYQKSLMLYSAEDFTGSNTALDNALNANRDYAVAYYQKGKVAKKLDENNLDEILSWYSRAIDIGDATNQQRISREAKEAAYDELLFRGSKMIEENQARQAIELLQLAITYNETSSMAYYRLAEANNKLGNRDAAITNARKALDFENGGNNDKAKIYFEIGLAHQAKNEVSSACSAFKSASFGSFRSPAEYAMEHELKCKEA